VVKLVAKKHLSASYTNMVLDNLKGSMHDLNQLRTEIGKIQCPTKHDSANNNNNNNNNNNQKPPKEKEIVLASAEGKGTFRGVCDNCKKKCGYQNKTCPHPKVKTGSGKTFHNCGMNGACQSRMLKDESCLSTTVVYI